MSRCANCRSSFHPGEPEHISGLYGSGNADYRLCRTCARHEEAMIEEKGGNFVPELLALYVDSEHDE